MPGKGKVGISTAGGVITGPGCPTVLVEGVPCVVVGDTVAPHGTGLHAAATMVSGSPTVFAGGKPVCREGDAASCGHLLTLGAPTVQVG